MSGFKKMGLLPSCLVSIAAVILSTALFCLAITPLFLRGFLPQEAGSSCASAAAGTAVFVMVFLTDKIRGRQAMPAAGIIAGGTVLLAVLVCALGGNGFNFGSSIFRLAAATIVGGLIGAVMSIRKSAGKRRGRHR